MLNCTIALTHIIECSLKLNFLKNERAIQLHSEIVQLPACNISQPLLQKSAISETKSIILPKTLLLLNSTLS